MARYKLTAAHFVTRANGIPAYLEAGTTIDRLEMPPHWEPTPLIVPLDDEAYAAHSEVMQRAIAKSGVEITGIGHLRNLPNGERHLAAAEVTPSPSGAIYWVEINRSNIPAVQGSNASLIRETLTSYGSHTGGTIRSIATI